MSNNKKSRRKNGDGNWGTRTINGVTYKYFRKRYDFLDSPKTFYGFTEKEINQKRMDFESSIEPYKRIKKSEIPKQNVTDGLLLWLHTEKSNDDIRQQTLDSYEDLINTFVKNTILGNAQIASLNQKLLDEYTNYLKDKYSLATIKRIFCVINQFFDYLVKKRYIGDNYARKSKKVTERGVAVKRKKIDFLDEDDMEKLYKEYSRTYPNGTSIYGINAMVVIFIMYTGMRVSECIALQWKDIDFKKNCISVTHSIIKIKNRESESPKYLLIDSVDEVKSLDSERVIPFCSRSLEIIEKLKTDNVKPTDYIFSTNSIIDRTNVTRTLNKMQKNAKCTVEKTGIHALRHSFGSYLILEGIDVKTVSELLGHSSIEITLDIYIHIINKQRMSAIKIFDKLDQPKDIKCLDILKENNINIIEIEEGMLGYIKDGVIVKLPITKQLVVSSDITFSNKQIYNEYYKTE